jgi:tetratricopeptide (TPR) repeat protein
VSKSLNILKAAIAIVFSLLVALVIFMLAAFNPDAELNRAMKFYLNGDNEQADNILTNLQPSLAPMRFHLYKAYVERAKNQMEASDKDLALAEKDVIDHANFTLMLEILLNQALNAYLTNNSEALNAAVKKAMKYGGPNQDWVLLFRGILDYHAGDYDKALALWKLDSSRPPLSAWMGKSFQEVFSNSWFVLHIVKGNIETGKTSSARQLIEKEIPLMSGDDLEQLLFLMAYSYTKEAKEKAPEAAIPYYKLAQSYLSRIPFLTDKYQQERLALDTQLYGQVEDMLQGGNYADISFFIALLQEWNAQEDLLKIRAALLKHFHQAVALGSSMQAQEIYSVLLTFLPNDEERKGLDQALQQVLGKSNIEALEEDARTGRIFFENEGSFSTSAFETAQDRDSPAGKLTAVQELIDMAVSDSKINALFNVEKSFDVQRASKLLAEFIQKYPDHVQAYVMLGQVKYLLGDFAGSVKAYETAIGLNPKDPAVYRYMALTYEEAHQAQDAILLLLQALRYAPKDADVWEQLADLYLMTGNDLDAQPSFKEALRIDPARDRLYLALGRLQVKLELPEEAGVNLKKYLEKYPDNQEALTLLLRVLYNPLLNINASNTRALEQQRSDIYQRLHAIVPEVAEQIRQGYHPPPAVISPPPEPEPNLPFLPQ